MARQTFSKKEHLVSLLDIKALFDQKSGVINAYPLRLIFKYSNTENSVPALVLISVSKRHFKHATDRNKAKRQISEAYRLQKACLWEALESKKKKIHLAFLWQSDSPVSSEKIASSMQKLLTVLVDKL